MIFLNSYFINAYYTLHYFNKYPWTHHGLTTPPPTYNMWRDFKCWSPSLQLTFLTKHQEVGYHLPNDTIQGGPPTPSNNTIQCVIPTLPTTFNDVVHLTCKQNLMRRPTHLSNTTSQGGPPTFLHISTKVISNYYVLISITYIYYSRYCNSMKWFSRCVSQQHIIL